MTKNDFYFTEKYCLSKVIFLKPHFLSLSNMFFFFFTYFKVFRGSIIIIHKYITFECFILINGWIIKNKNEVVWIMCSIKYWDYKKIERLYWKWYDDSMFFYCICLSLCIMICFKKLYIWDCMLTILWSYILSKDSYNICFFVSL